jgi:hypothetical protein
LEHVHYVARDSIDREAQKKINKFDFQPQPVTLEERGFNVQNLRAKCSPVCPFKNDNCCMARILSKQEDFTNQTSMLETVIWEAGHFCIFLPKFHCELNPIEMVSYSFIH